MTVIVYALNAPNRATDRKNHDEAEQLSPGPTEPHELIDQRWRVELASGLVLNFIILKNSTKYKVENYFTKIQVNYLMEPKNDEFALCSRK